MSDSPAVSAETWSPQLAPGQKVDLNQLRDEIKSRLDAGDYEGALQRQLWYFNHALEHDEVNPVRLSFGIAPWRELARRYPKAKQAMLEVRNQKTREFAEGRGNFDLFQEVAALNRELQDDAATLELYQRIEKQDVALAEQCRFVIRSMENRKPGKPTTAPAFSFGPVVERTLLLNDTKPIVLLDLDQGNYLALPDEFASYFQKQEWFLWEDPTMAAKVERLKSWIQSSGADVFVQGSGREMNFLYSTMGLWRPSVISNLFDAVTAKSVIQRNDANEAEQKPFTRIPPLIGLDIQSALASPPCLVAFRTRQGANGVMQIVASIENPRGVKIRYKLVQKAAGDSTTSSDASSGGGGEVK